MKLTNLLENRTATSLKLNDTEQKFYHSTQMVILDSTIKLKPNVEKIEDIRSEHDISSVWLEGVPFNYTEYLTRGNDYIDEILNTPKDKIKVVLKTKNMEISTLVTESLQDNKHMVINTDMDNIAFVIINGMLNFTTKARTQLDVLFSDILNLKDKVQPLSIERLRELYKSGHEEVFQKIQKFDEDNGLDDYDYDKLSYVFLDNRVEGAYSHNRELVKEVLNRFKVIETKEDEYF